MHIAPTPLLQHAFNALTRPIRRPITDRDQTTLASAQRFDIEFEQGQITRWHWSHQGPHILLVHGWESRASHWHAWIEPLVQAGMQVSAIDLPAHGDATGDETDVVQCGRAVLATYHSMPKPLAMVGHSMGSAACLYAFARGARVSSSIHLAGPSSLSRVIGYTAHVAGLDRSGRTALLQAMEERTGQAVDQMDPNSLQLGMRHEALIFHDPQDAEMPYLESQELHKHWPHARLITLDGVGHRHIQKDPNVILQSIEAFSSHSLKS